MRRGAAMVERPKPMTLEQWAALDEDVDGELARDGRYTVALTASRSRVRVPGCAGLTLDLDDLWHEADRLVRSRAGQGKRRRH